MSKPGGSSGICPRARFVCAKKPGTKKTNSTSTMFVTKVGTQTPISDASEL